MAKRRTRKVGKGKKKDTLQEHNDLGYLDDLQHICKLGYISESKRDWIETTMLELRESANKYEHQFGEFLMKRNIKFIHQAPFIIDGKIFFADFYIPDKSAIVEIDGTYHDGITQHNKDRFRDACFGGRMIRTIRIPNGAFSNIRNVEMLCEGIIH